MFLNPQMHELLLTLDRAKLLGGDGWVAVRTLKHIGANVRNHAYQKGYIAGRGKTSARQYKILPPGRTALANNAQANMGVMDQLENGFVPTGEESAAPFRHVPEDPSLTIVEPAAPLRSFPGLDAEIHPGFVKSLAVSAPKLITEKNNGHSDPRARACVQAIDILAEDWPEVGDLVDVLMKLQARKAANHE